MNNKRIATTLALTAAGLATSLSLSTGTAVAAPSGPSATEAISRLQANGNRVIVNKVGAGPTDQCTVTSVRPVQTRPAPSGNPLTGVPNLQVGTTVHVGLQC
jgi:uncharacterized membrane protein